MQPLVCFLCKREVGMTVASGLCDGCHRVWLLEGRPLRRTENAFWAPCRRDDAEGSLIAMANQPLEHSRPNLPRTLPAQPADADAKAAEVDGFLRNLRESMMNYSFQIQQRHAFDDVMTDPMGAVPIDKIYAGTRFVIDIPAEVAARFDSQELLTESRASLSWTAAPGATGHETHRGMSSVRLAPFTGEPMTMEQAEAEFARRGYVGQLMVRPSAPIDARCYAAMRTLRSCSVTVVGPTWEAVLAELPGAPMVIRYNPEPPSDEVEAAMQRAAADLKLPPTSASPAEPIYGPSPLLKFAQLQIVKLSPKPGDLLTLRLPTAINSNEREGLLVGLRSIVPEGVTWLVLNPGQEVKTVSEEAMRAAGWVRTDWYGVGVDASGNFNYTDRSPLARLVRAADNLNQNVAEFGKPTDSEFFNDLHEALAKLPGTRTHAMAQQDFQDCLASEKGGIVSSSWEVAESNPLADIKEANERMQRQTGYSCPGCGCFYGERHRAGCPAYSPGGELPTPHPATALKPDEVIFDEVEETAPEDRSPAPSLMQSDVAARMGCFGRSSADTKCEKRPVYHATYLNGPAHVCCAEHASLARSRGAKLEKLPE